MFSKPKFSLLFSFLFLTTFAILAQPYSLDWVNVSANTIFIEDRDLAVDEMGNVIDIGHFRGFTDFDAGPGKFLELDGRVDTSNTGYIRKTNQDGSFAWAITLFSERLNMKVVECDQAGNIYVAGNGQDSIEFKNSTGTTNLIFNYPQNQFILKIDPNGKILWLQEPDGFIIDDIDINKAQNLVLAGAWGGTADFDPGPGTHLTPSQSLGIFVLEWTSNRSFIKVDTIRHTASFRIQNLAFGPSGSYYITGTFKDTIHINPNHTIGSSISFRINDSTVYFNSDHFILRMDSIGNVEWAHSLNTTGGSNHNYIPDVVVDKSGNATIAGFIGGDSLMLDGIIWLGDGDFPTSPGFIVQFSPSGSINWQRILKVPEAVTFYDNIAMDDSGQIYLSGQFDTVVDFDFGSGQDFDTTLGFWDVFLQKIDAAGNHIWMTSFGAVASDFSNNLIIDKFQKPLLTGAFSQTVDFDPTPRVFELSKPGFCFKSQFMLRLKNCPYSNGHQTGYGCSGAGYGNSFYSVSQSFFDTVSTIGQCDSLVRIDIQLADIDTNVLFSSYDGSLLMPYRHGATYQWVDCNNNFQPIQGATSRFFLPQQNGNYAAIVSIDSCSSVSQCYSYDNVSYEEWSFLISEIQVFPNPATENVVIEKQDEDVQIDKIVLTNLQGKSLQILNWKAKEQAVLLDVGTFSEGLYILSFHQKGQLVFSKSLAIQR